MSDRDDIIAAANAGTLPELFVERLRRHRTDELGKAFRATLTKLHHDGTIDVLEPARQIATSPIDQHDFFTVMHVYTELIPTLDASVTDMLAAVKALSIRAGEDLASGMPNGAYRRWAEQDSRACDTLETINPEDGEDSAYIFLALQALAKTKPDAALDRAILYVGGNAGPARSAAAKAIGTFDVNDPERRAQAINALTVNCRQRRRQQPRPYSHRDLRDRQGASRCPRRCRRADRGQYRPRGRLCDSPAFKRADVSRR